MQQKSYRETRKMLVCDKDNPIDSASLSTNSSSPHLQTESEFTNNRVWNKVLSRMFLWQRWNIRAAYIICSYTLKVAGCM